MEGRTSGEHTFFVILNSSLTPTARWGILSESKACSARGSDLTKSDFISLFAGNDELVQAAETWWDRLETSDHPYGRLWFRHWCCETRAHPQIARAFQTAHELGLVDSLADTPYHLLQQLAGKLVKMAPGRIGDAGLCSGDKIDLGSPGEALASWVQLKLDNVDSFTNEEVEEELENSLRRRKESSLPIWITAQANPNQRYPEPGAPVDDIRDELGTAHWRQRHRFVVIVYEGKPEPNVHFPTMLDSQLAFFRPVPQGHMCGYTLNLQSGRKGVCEAVTLVDPESWAPLREGGSIRVYSIQKEYYEETEERTDYYSLCEYLCKLDTQDCS